MPTMQVLADLKERHTRLIEGIDRVVVLLRMLELEGGEEEGIEQLLEA